MHRWPPHPQALLIGLLLPLIGWAQTEQQRNVLDTDAGLGHLHLGLPVDSLLEEITFGGRARGAERYYYKTPNLLGLPQGVRLQYVALYVDQQRIVALEAKTEDKKASEALLAYLEARYGPGVQQGRAPRYNWSGNRMQLAYDQNLLSGVAVASFELK